MARDFYLSYLRRGVDFGLTLVQSVNTEDWTGRTPVIVLHPETGSDIQITGTVTNGGYGAEWVALGQTVTYLWPAGTYHGSCYLKLGSTSRKLPYEFTLILEEPEGALP